MGSLSRSPGAQGRGAPPRADARYGGGQAATLDRLDFAVDVRAARPSSWLVERLGERLGDLGRYPSQSDHRRATDAVGFTAAGTGALR